MRTALWWLLALLSSLATPGRSDCHSDCWACSSQFHQQELKQAFNPVMCLLECEGVSSSSSLWELCHRVFLLLQHRPPPEGGVVSQQAGQWLPLPHPSPEDGGGERERGRMEATPTNSRPEIMAPSKRFGGFMRGRHGYRKMAGVAPRSLQKRYGGFIGVRKAARKWNSQKRVNQLLRHYLGTRLRGPHRSNRS